MPSWKVFLFKDLFNAAIQYFYYVVKLLSTVFKLKLSFKLQIDIKACTLKHLKEISQEHLVSLISQVYLKLQVLET